MKRLSIRGIEILAVKNQTAFIHFLLEEQDIRTGKLVAINAEKVILAEEDPTIQQIIADAEYKYADGISIVKSIHKKFPDYRYIERIAGADLWLGLMQRSAELQIPVFLIGGQAVVLAQTFAKLTEMGVKVVGRQDGYFDPNEEEQLIQKVKASGARIITVALGSPKQENLMARMQQAYPDALYMGVGGSYDVFVGKVKRAPKGWQRLGLEWLYRLFHQPTRWKRQKRLLKYAYYYLTNQL